MIHQLNVCGALALVLPLLAPAGAAAQRELASFPVGKSTSMSLRAVALSPDGTRAAALMRGGSKRNGDVAADHVRVWDLKAKKEVLLFETGWAPSFPGSLFAYTPGGKKLVASTDKGLYVFDARTGRQDTAFEARVSPTVSALSADGKRAVCAADGEVAAYDLGSGKELLALGAKDLANPRTIALSPDGRLAAVSDKVGTVHLLDIKAKKVLPALPREGRTRKAVLAFSPDSRRLAACDDDRRFTVVDLKTRKVAHRLNLQDYGVGIAPEGLAFTPDGRRVVAAGTASGAGVFLWEPRTGKVFGDKADRGNNHRGLALSADGKLLVTGEKQLKVFDLSKPNELKPD